MLAPTTEMLRKAKEEGAEDNHVHNEIVNSALLYFEELELPEETTDHERDLIQERVIDSYCKGVASCY